MSIAGCCCAGPEPLDCTSCYGGNHCYPFQPANCPNEPSRTYRIVAVSGGRCVTDYSQEIAFLNASFRCPVDPCAALVSVCTGCTYSSLGGCNGSTSATVDLCTRPMQRCDRSVSIYAGERVRGAPQQLWKSTMTAPNYQSASTPLVSCGGCGAPATYQEYWCDPFFGCTPPCNTPNGNPINLPCNLGQCSTFSCSEVDAGHEWLYETTSTATMEWTWSCADAGVTNFKQMTAVSGSGVSGFYQRGVATQANVSACSGTTTTGWLGNMAVAWDGFANPIQTAVRASNDTFVTTLVNGICPRMDALVLKFRGAATWRQLSTGNDYTLYTDILGVYYGCPDLDLQNAANPKYKTRPFRLDRWTIPTRLIPSIGGVGADYLCPVGAQCGANSALPAANGQCDLANPQLAGIRDLLNSGGYPTSYQTMKAMYCVSDTVSPPVAVGDEYGCWWAGDAENTFIPKSIDVVRQGAW